ATREDLSEISGHAPSRRAIPSFEGTKKETGSPPPAPNRGPAERWLFCVALFDSRIREMSAQGVRVERARAANSVRSRGGGNPVLRELSVWPLGPRFRGETQGESRAPAAQTRADHEREARGRDANPGRFQSSNCAAAIHAAAESLKPKWAQPFFLVAFLAVRPPRPPSSIPGGT